MPNEFSLDNLPTGIIYKSQEEKEEAIKAGNLALSKGQTIDQAEFAASSAVSRLIKQRRGSDSIQVKSKRSTPSHLSAILQKSNYELTEEPKEDSKKEPRIRRAF